MIKLSYFNSKSESFLESFKKKLKSFFYKRFTIVFNQDDVHSYTVSLFQVGKIQTNQQYYREHNWITVKV